jgi:hypothetical protein
MENETLTNDISDNIFILIIAFIVIMGVLEFLLSILPILSILLAIISIYIGYYFYTHPQKIKNPCYAIRNINLIRGLVKKFGEDLEILYRKNNIENFTATKVAFWNLGKDTINKDDIAPADPLEIYVKEGFEILDVKILFAKKSVNQFDIKLSEDHKSVKILFEYLDQDDGGVIQILHTGKSAEDIGVRGSVKGVKELTCTSSPKSFIIRFFSRTATNYPKTRFNKVMDILLFLFPIIIGALILFSPPVNTTYKCAEATMNGNIQGLWCIPNTIPQGLETRVPYLILIIIMIIPYSLFIYYTNLRRRIPKGFDIFEEDI